MEFFHYSYFLDLFVGFTTVEDSEKLRFFCYLFLRMLGIINHPFQEVSKLMKLILSVAFNFDFCPHISNKSSNEYCTIVKVLYLWNCKQLHAAITDRTSSHWSDTSDW